MTILLMGGELSAFAPSDADSFEYTSAFGTGAGYDSGFARCAIAVRGAASYFTSPVFTTSADFWLHFEIAQDQPITSATLQTVCTMLDSGGTERIRLKSDNPFGGGTVTWQLEYWNGSAWASLGSSFTATHSRQTIDIRIISNSVSGSGTVYFSGTQRSTGTADLSAFTGIARVRFYGKTISYSSGVGISQVVGTDESTIGMRLGTIYMSGAGATDQWTGTYADVDEVTYSDADFIYSSAANEVDLYTGTSVPAFTGYTIRAIAVTGRVKKGSSGPTQAQLALRSGSTTYFSGNKALDLAYGSIINIWETNPDTSAAWLSTAISSLQYGLKSIA